MPRPSRSQPRAETGVTLAPQATTAPVIQPVTLNATATYQGAAGYGYSTSASTTIYRVPSSDSGGKRVLFLACPLKYWDKAAGKWRVPGTDKLLVGRAIRVWARTPQGSPVTFVGVYRGNETVEVEGVLRLLLPNSEVR